LALFRLFSHPRQSHFGRPQIAAARKIASDDFSSALFIALGEMQLGWSFNRRRVLSGWRFDWQFIIE